MSALIDLTHIIYPEHTPRRFSVETIGAETVNKNVVRLQGQWYIMSKISMVSHIATHIEVPYHLFLTAVILLPCLWKSVLARLCFWISLIYKNVWRFLWRR